MPKYLFEVNYVGEGIKGLLKDGGTARKAAAETELREDILRARAWLSAACRDHALPDRLDRPLLADLPQRALLA